MGYTTEFSGKFELDKPLNEYHLAYLEMFNETRRMKRDVDKLDGSILEDVGLPLGTEGEYYVVDDGNFGQTRDDSIVDYNYPPRTQPGLWCGWRPNEEGTAIEWDGGEKFYYYIQWIEYIIGNFISRWGYTLNGTVKWTGEDIHDIGIITVENNKISVKAL